MPISIEQILQQQPSASFTNVEMNELLMSPAVRYFTNLASKFFRVKRNVTNKGWKLNFLSEDGIHLQPNRDCDWTPQGKLLQTSRKLHVCPFKVNNEMCRDEFWDSCLEQLGGNETARGDLDATQAGRMLKQMMFAIFMKGIRNNITETVWLGKESLTVAELANANPLNPQISKGDFIAKAFQMLSHCDGLLHDIHAGDMIVTDDLATYANTDLPADYAPSLFKAMKFGTAGRLLEHYDESNSAFLVSQSVFQNYYEYLHEKYNGIPTGYTLETEGVGDALLWNGIPVVKLNGFELMMHKFYGIRKRHFAIYTVLENFAFGTDIVAADGTPQLIIEGGKEVTTRKKIFIDGEFKIGTKVAYPELLNAAFSFSY